MAAVRTVREQAALNPQKPLVQRAPEPEPSPRYRFAEATSVPKLLLLSLKGEGAYTHVDETLRREPRVRDFGRNSPPAFHAGRHGRDGDGHRGPRDGPLARLRLRRDVLEGRGR